MSKRKSIPKAVETAVLLKSRRRCALCYYLQEDLSEKKGQLAHLDHDPSNNEEENLAYLCLNHHDEFDRGTSQAKGLTAAEVKHARRLLFESAPESSPPSAQGLLTQSDVLNELHRLRRLAWPSRVLSPSDQVPRIHADEYSVAYVRALGVKAGYAVYQSNLNALNDLVLADVRRPGTDAAPRLEVTVRHAFVKGFDGKPIPYPLDDTTFEKLRFVSLHILRILIVVALPPSITEWLLRWRDGDLDGTPNTALPHSMPNAYWMSLRGEPERTPSSGDLVTISSSKILTCRTLRVLMDRTAEGRYPDERI